MKISQRKRLKDLEKMFNIKSKRQRVARVIYDASSGFDPSTLEIDAEVVLMLPDNGMRATDKIDLSVQPYQIFYG